MIYQRANGVPRGADFQSARLPPSILYFKRNAGTLGTDRWHDIPAAFLLRLINGMNRQSGDPPAQSDLRKVVPIVVQTRPTSQERSRNERRFEQPVIRHLRCS